MKHIVVLLTVSFALLLSCATTTAKKFYILNYQPETLTNRLSQNPWPCTIRVRDFSIEGAYARNQIVYRRSPYELEYYFYHNWAVKPSSMLTDIVRRHLQAVNLVNNVILRYDEGTMPDYELSGTISSIEEYDSETAWFAHLAFSVKLTRISDNTVVFTRDFDSRRQLKEKDPQFVVIALSEITDFAMRECVDDIDRVLANEYGPKMIPSDTTNRHP